MALKTPIDPYFSLSGAQLPTSIGRCIIGPQRWAGISRVAVADGDMDKYKLQSDSIEVVTNG
jgi:hypothetical protein